MATGTLDHTPVDPAATPDEDLDFAQFRARHFPGRTQRHDFAAAIAYGRYRQQRATRGEHASDGSLAASAVSSWEGEGGATA